MSTIAAHRSLTHAGPDFWADFISRLDTWFEKTPAQTTHLAATPEDEQARKIANRRFWREMRILESCQ